MVEKRLNSKEKSFIEHYCTDAKCNASLAYRLAGYSPHGANSLASRKMAKDSIKLAIDEKNLEMAEKLEITAQLCTQRFNDMYWHCVSAGDNAGALRAVENHAKHKGYYEADKDRTGVQLQLNIAAQQAQIDEYIALGRALDDAPDAMAK